MNNCFLLLVIASLAIVSGCSSDAPTSSDPEVGGVQTMDIIDADSGE